jgi:uroporphyrinogen-III synthase
LMQYGIVHVVRENSAEELAYKIIEEKIEQVDFFCGNLRREELPVILEENGIIVTEHEVYKTEFTPQKFKNQYDAILFFSPSGVLSYFSEQNSRDTVAFCLGNTTAVEAIDYFENVYAAEEPSVESLIESVNEYYKNE